MHEKTEKKKRILWRLSTAIDSSTSYMTERGKPWPWTRLRLTTSEAHFIRPDGGHFDDDHDDDDYSISLILSFFLSFFLPLSSLVVKRERHHRFCFVFSDACWRDSPSFFLQVNQWFVALSSSLALSLIKSTSLRTKPTIVRSSSVSC